MRVSPHTAARTLALLAYFDGDASRAAHEVSVGLRAIEPYTDRKSAAVLDAIRWARRMEAKGKAPEAIYGLERVAALAENT